MLRRLWILVVIGWLIGGTVWVVTSDWGYVKYRREEAQRQEGIAAYEASSGKTYKQWQEECLSQPPEPQAGFFPPPIRDCNFTFAMPPREGMDYYRHEYSVLAPIIYTHFRKPLLFTVLLPVLVSGPLVLWLIPGLARWVRHGSRSATVGQPRRAEAPSTVVRGRNDA